MDKIIQYINQLERPYQSFANRQIESIRALNFEGFAQFKDFVVSWYEDWEYNINIADVASGKDFPQFDDIL